MLLGILSDTHDKLERTQAAVELLHRRGAQALIHCGDLTSAAIVAELALLPSWFVLGNNDVDTVAELKQAAAESGVTCLGWGGVAEVGGKRIGAVHGDQEAQRRRVLATGPDFLLSGHTHVALDTMVDGVRSINPGALHRAPVYTVALLDLENNTVRYCEIGR